SLVAASLRDPSAPLRATHPTGRLPEQPPDYGSPMLKPPFDVSYRPPPLWNQPVPSSVPFSFVHTTFPAAHFPPTSRFPSYPTARPRQSPSRSPISPTQGPHMHACGWM